jgi:NAD-dependent SIR2 family protein deacetylase
MPIKPTPLHFRCTSCGWQETFAPPSDALIRPYPRQCPKCGSDLESRPAGALDSLWATVKNRLMPR